LGLAVGPNPATYGKRSSFLIASCIVIATIISGCGGSERYIERGNQFYAAGKYEDAVLNYQNAIKKDARSGEAYYRLGLAQLKLNHGGEAYQALSRSVALSPQNFSAKERLASFSLAIYTRDPRHPAFLYKQAQSLTDELLKKDPNSPDGLRLKGALALIDNKPAEAVDAIRRALGTSPDSEELQTALADSLLKDHRFEEGDRAARDAIKKHPQYAPPYELLYSFYAAERRDADIADLLKLWMANDPNNPGPVLRLAAYYYKQRKAADAENLLSSLLEQRGGIPQPDLVVGDFHAIIGNREQALADYRRGQSLDPAHRGVYQERQASMLAALGRRDEALQTLGAILANDSKNQFARAGKAAILMQIGGAQNLNAAAVLAGDLAKEAPADARIQMLAAQTFAAKGDLNAATASFQQAAKADPGLLTARLALSQMALLRKNYQAVLENAGAALAINPADPNARLFRVIGLTETGAYAQAKTEADQLARDTDNKGPVERQLGIIALRQKNYQEAERQFQKAYREGDPNPSALAGLLGTYIGEHQPDKALQLAEAELRRSPQSSNDAALLIASAQAAGKPDVALSELRKLAAQNPSSAEVQIQIGNLQRTQGNLPAALEAFERALQLAPQRADIVATIANVQEALGQKREAITNYRKALSQTSGDPLILNNLAFLLTETHGDLNEALSLATTASRKSPDSADIKDTLAWIHIQRGESAAMIPVLAQLTRSYPSNSTYRYHYAVALFQKGDRASAKQQLETALSNGPAKQTESQIRNLLTQLR